MSLILSLLLLLPFGKDSLLTIEKISEAEFKRATASYKNPFTVDTSSVKKINGVISVPLKNGEKKKLKDVLPYTKYGDDYREYTYVGKLNEELYVFHVGIQEDESENLLIDSRNGCEYKIWDFPYLSPDKKRMVCWASSETGNGHRGIQLWLLSPTKLKKINEGTGAQWSVGELFWGDDSKTIYCEANVLGEELRQFLKITINKP